MTMIPQDVVDLVDAGEGYVPGGHVDVRACDCARTDCRQKPVVGHDFCAPCLAWLRGDDEHDPLAKEPPPQLLSSLAAGPYPPVGCTGEAWYRYLAAACGEEWVG